MKNREIIKLCRISWWGRGGVAPLFKNGAEMYAGMLLR